MPSSEQNCFSISVDQKSMLVDGASGEISMSFTPSALPKHSLEELQFLPKTEDAINYFSIGLSLLLKEKSVGSSGLSENEQFAVAALYQVLGINHDLPNYIKYRISDNTQTVAKETWLDTQLQFLPCVSDENISWEVLMNRATQIVVTIP